MTAATLDVLNARLIRAHNEHPWLGCHEDPKKRSTLRPPCDGERLHTSYLAACLTHLTRLVTEFADGRRCAAAMCGNEQINAVWVDPADETFVCRRCHVAAERWGRPTFGLVPDSGCSVSGGKRGLKGRRT